MTVRFYAKVDGLGRLRGFWRSDLNTAAGIAKAKAEGAIEITPGQYDRWLPDQSQRWDGRDVVAHVPEPAELEAETAAMAARDVERRAAQVPDVLLDLIRVLGCEDKLSKVNQKALALRRKLNREA